MYLATMSCGMPAGPQAENQAKKSKPVRPCSCSEGSEGASAERSRAEPPIACILPPLPSVSATPSGTNIAAIWPPIKSVKAGAEPL